MTYYWSYIFFCFADGVHSGPNEGAPLNNIAAHTGPESSAIISPTCVLIGCCGRKAFCYLRRHGAFMWMSIAANALFTMRNY